MTKLNSSPQLAGLLRRNFSPKDSSFLAEVYELTLASGGTNELDFERSEGVSFNPRPARIAQILITDGEVKDVQVVASGMLGTISPANRSTIESKGGISDDILELAAQSEIPVESLYGQVSSDEGNKPFHDAAVIALAHWLDRIRHLHLSETRYFEEHLPLFLKRNLTFILLAERECPSFVPYLSLWQSRFSNSERVGPQKMHSAAPQTLNDDTQSARRGR